MCVCLPDIQSVIKIATKLQLLFKSLLAMVHVLDPYPGFSTAISILWAAIRNWLVFSPVDSSNNFNSKSPSQNLLQALGKANFVTTTKVKYPYVCGESKQLLQISTSLISAIKSWKIASNMDVKIGLTTLCLLYLFTVK